MSLTYGFCLGPDDTVYNSAQFSEAFRALIGDGISDYGGKFALAAQTGFHVAIETGFAVANGRWLKSDEKINMTLPQSLNHRDRYDAIALTVNYAQKTVTLGILTDVDMDAVRADPSVIRNEKSYSILLYLVHIRRGATAIMERDITDLRESADVCGRLISVQSVAAKALVAYSFLTGGIDERVAHILGLAEAATAGGAEALKELESIIRQNAHDSNIGDVVTSLRRPAPASAWLLCDGSAVPEAYPELSALLAGVLPDIRNDDERFKNYIYGGKPQS